MTKTITRVEIANSYQTVFRLFDDQTGEGQEIGVPCWNADANELTLESLDWNELDNMYAASSETPVVIGE